MVKTIKENDTGKEPLPEYLFAGKEKPNDTEWIEIADRFEKHFPFLSVFGFDPDIAFKYYTWYSKYYEDGVHTIELKPTHNSDSLCLSMTLAILEKLQDLPEFVTIKEN